MKALKGDNVVQCFDVLTDPKTIYIILEFCEGGDINDFLEQNGGQLKEEVLVEVANQLIKGFRQLVDHGYIHRDVKPANALHSKGFFKVADFGFACKADKEGHKRIRECVGTPLYMSPQLQMQQPYTSKSDIWSIGFMFYEMLFGTTPWECRSLESFLYNIKTKPLRFPYSKPIDPVTKDCLTKMLKVSEQERISWDDLFAHPFLNKSSFKVEQFQIVLNQESQNILKEIQNYLEARQRTPQDFLKKFNQEKMSVVDFYSFLKYLSPNVTFNNAQNLFQEIDASKDGNVNATELASILDKYDFNEVSKAQSILKSLQQVILHNHFDVYALFQQFDYCDNDNFDFNEFSKCIKAFAKDISERDLKDLFKVFDVNQDHTISFNEFTSILLGQLEQNKNPRDQDQAWFKVQMELKKIVKENKLDLLQIYNNFDKNKDGMLEINEFIHLCQVIDKNISNLDVNELFKQYDSTQSGLVDLNEFKVKLQ